MSNYVQPFDQVKEADASIVGGKAANLAKLIQNGLPVPKGFAVGLSAFTDESKLSDDAKQHIKQQLSPNKLYAVRSSALAEDAEGASWAGQFETFLNTKLEDVIEKIEECHNSAKSRAKSYADDKGTTNFDIAVAVQEMLKPEYAGVLFTKDPLSGKDLLVTEYVAGLGEELVSGRADPKKVILSSDEAKQAPFDTAQLAELATKVEQLFGTPQDIEWVWADNKIWLVQARPITATQETRAGYYLGEPDDLFYWGPARAKPAYMSDFMAAAEQFFMNMYKAPELPNPPKALALFAEGKNVWLLNAEAFADFTEKTFEAYSKRDQLSEDYANWQKTANGLNSLTGSELEEKLVDAFPSLKNQPCSILPIDLVMRRRVCIIHALRSSINSASLRASVRDCTSSSVSSSFWINSSRLFSKFCEVGSSLPTILRRSSKYLAALSDRPSYPFCIQGYFSAIACGF